MSGKWDQGLREIFREDSERREKGRSKAVCLEISVMDGPIRKGL